MKHKSISPKVSIEILGCKKTRGPSIGVYIPGSPYKGGSFQYVLMILGACNLLIKSGVRITVVYTSVEWDNYLISFDGVKIHRKLSVLDRIIHFLYRKHYMSSRSIRLLNKSIGPMNRSLERLSLDLWLIPLQKDSSFLFTIKSIGTIHDLMHRYETEYPELIEKSQYERRENLFNGMVKWCVGILVDSSIGKTHVVQSYEADPSRIHVLPFYSPPYEIFLGRTRTSLNDLKNKFNISVDDIIYPAQFWSHKNHVALIRAMAILKTVGAGINLVLVGSEKNSKESVKTMISALGLQNDIILLNYVSHADLLGLIEHAICLVMATHCGPTNIPPLEAFKLGVPVVASDVYGVKKQLKDAALYFNPNMPVELAKNIQKIHEEHGIREMLTTKGFEWISNWDMIKFSKRMQVIIEYIIEEQVFEHEK